MVLSLANELAHHLSLHASDFVPTSTEALALRTSIEEYENFLYTLDLQVSGSVRPREELRAHRVALSELCALKKALLAPIRKLPSEILGLVFSWCIPEFTDPSIPYNNTTRDSAPFLLTQVCKRWQFVAHGTPQLWNTLGLYGLCGINPFVLISTWLRRSGALPIDIYINPLSWHYPIHYDSFKNHIIPDTMQSLGLNFNRCRTFHSTNLPSVLEGIFPEGSHVYAPLLREFRITPCPKSSGNFLSGNLTTPNLESIDVCDPHRTLQSITMNTHNLRSLRWNGSCVSWAEYASLEHLATFLRSCPNLEECDIVRPTPSGDFLSPGRTMISLPRLRRLSVTWKSTVDLGDLFCLLDFPALESLRLEIDRAASTRANLKGALTTLFPASKSSPPLKELEVVHLDVIKSGDSPRVSEFAPILTLPHLERLRFQDCTLHGALLESLTLGPDQPQGLWNLPRLSTLHLSRVEFDGPHFVRMLESRVSTSAEMLKSASLVHCDRISSSDRAALRALAERHEGRLVIEGLDPANNSLEAK